VILKNIKVMLSRILESVKSSIKDPSGKVSHTRISSYFILGSILSSSATFIGIDIGNAILMWLKGETYTIPWDHVAIFALILGHHLILLGLKKSSDNSIMGTGGSVSDVDKNNH
jgi:ABC-type Fe3+-siderophore transport system permease subunit